MKTDIFSEIINDVKYMCNDCPDKRECEENHYDCIVNNIIYKVNGLRDGIDLSVPSGGCSECTTKNGKFKEIFYCNDRGGLTLSNYCPSCGKKL